MPSAQAPQEPPQPSGPQIVDSSHFWVQHSPSGEQTSPPVQAQSTHDSQFSPWPGWQAPSPHEGATTHWLEMHWKPFVHLQSTQQVVALSSPSQTPSPHPSGSPHDAPTHPAASGSPAASPATVRASGASLTSVGDAASLGLQPA